MTARCTETQTTVYAVTLGTHDDTHDGKTAGLPHAAIR